MCGVGERILEDNSGLREDTQERNILEGRILRMDESIRLDLFGESDWSWQKGGRHFHYFWPEMVADRWRTTCWDSKMHWQAAYTVGSRFAGEPAENTD